MNNLKLTKQQLTILKQNLVELAALTTKSYLYLSDIILDFNMLERWNDNDELPDELIMIARVNGVELGTRLSDRIKYFMQQIYDLQDNTIKPKDKIYLIDVKKLSQCQDPWEPQEIDPTWTDKRIVLGNYSNIRDVSNTEACCIVEVKHKEDMEKLL